ncbi:hypothetical protein BX666DRAFT_1979154 [Dichotomocladium elegans]|nr:hypothetical protein BX666DRAFT_1979154 [Dichotomocladium elegans]
MCSNRIRFLVGSPSLFFFCLMFRRNQNNRCHVCLSIYLYIDIDERTSMLRASHTLKY